MAILNIRGRGTTDATLRDKWLYINQIIKQDRIGVLMLQKTHLDEEFVTKLNELYRHRLKIMWSSTARHGSQAQCITIVLNKEITNIKNVTFIKIIPGQAGFLTLP